MHKLIIPTLFSLERDDSNINDVLPRGEKYTGVALSACDI